MSICPSFLILVFKIFHHGQSLELSHAQLDEYNEKLPMEFLSIHPLGDETIRSGVFPPNIDMAIRGFHLSNDFSPT